TIKESTYEAIEMLRKRHVKIIMVSGDSRKSAEAVASRLGLDGVEAEVLPADKGRLVQSIKSDGNLVAMAGDGINDAPALSAADVGIAMGTGADIAMEAADIVLVRGDLRGIARALELSRAMMLNIKQNLWLAFLYNVLALPVAAGVLYPHFHILLNPMVA